MTTVEERAAGFKMACAEAGYPNVEMRIHSQDEFGWVVSSKNPIPREVSWRALRLVDNPITPCHACWVELHVDCLALGQFVEDCGVER